MGNQAQACCNKLDKEATEVEAIQEDVDQREEFVKPRGDDTSDTIEAIQEDVDQREEFVKPKGDDTSETMSERKGITLLENPAPKLSRSQEVAQGKQHVPSKAPSAPKKHGVGIDFDVGGLVVTFTTKRKPLGIIFKTSSPMTVGSVRQGSHAEELGVKPGWVMKAVGGEDVSNMNFEQSLAALQRHTTSLPTESNSVEIVFEGQDKSVIASRRPLGIVFEQNIGQGEMPLQVKHVIEDSHAEKLCVKPGWVVKSIAGDYDSALDFDPAWTLTFHASMDYDAALDLFKRSMASLPEERPVVPQANPKTDRQFFRTLFRTLETSVEMDTAENRKLLRRSTSTLEKLG